MTYQVKIYRRDSESVVEYNNVKHVWWNRYSVLVISVLRSLDKPEHDYWEWPREMIDHVKIEKMTEMLK